MDLTTHFVVDVCDIYAIKHVVFEVVPQYPSQDIEGNVRPVQIIWRKKTKMSTFKRQIVFAGCSTAQLWLPTWRVPCVRHRTLLARSSTTSPCSPSEEQTAPETWQEVEKLYLDHKITHKKNLETNPLWCHKVQFYIFSRSVINHTLKPSETTLFCSLLNMWTVQQSFSFNRRLIRQG